ncbi:LytTR family DNA-binding domain-containing protein [Ruminococcaceae bacterium OttesenSCG-928-A16]|nr:LytTR family DNA-binding domain-containing protein [Ruminococcaceae bacterium OttesenSCG-928-A16]
MYKLAICDDEQAFANNLATQLEEIMPEFGLPYSVSVFTDASLLLEHFKQEKNPFDILLLDILMDKMNGMDLAEEIRELGSPVSIVFTTSSKEYSIKGYTVQAINYLLKPVHLDELRAVIAYDLRENHNSRNLVFKQGRVWRKISSDDIQYLEIKGRKVAVRLLNEFAYYSGKLDELEQQLPPKQFVRCHQSFVLNLKTVQEITRNEALLKDGTSLPISRAYLPQVQQAFLSSFSVES